MTTRPLALRDGEVVLEGTLELPPTPRGLVVFSHGSGSSRHSPRNRFVARTLVQAGIATLLFDLLSVEEDGDYRRRFDIDLLTTRLALAVDQARRDPVLHRLRIGLFGASTGAASALRVAAAHPDAIAAVVSRGGRPDLAGETALRLVTAPTLLIVGGHDPEVLALNRDAAESLSACERQLVVVPAATHLFEEPGALERVADEAAQWFMRHLAPVPAADA